MATSYKNPPALNDEIPYEQWTKEIKAIGGVRVKIFILSYFKELHKGDQRLFTECQN